MAQAQPKAQPAERAERESAAEWVAIDAVHPWKGNPRRNAKAIGEVARSIKRFGFGAPILARKNGEIIAGHTRHAAARKLGLDRVPVRYLDLDPAEAHVLALADNRLGEIADWDEDLLAAVVADLKRQDVNLTSGTGFDDAAIAKLMAGIEADESLGAPDESGALGDKYQVIIECTDERQQAMLIERLQGEGFEVRALIG